MENKTRTSPSGIPVRISILAHYDVALDKSKIALEISHAIGADLTETEKTEAFSWLLMRHDKTPHFELLKNQLQIRHIEWHKYTDKVARSTIEVVEIEYAH